MNNSDGAIIQELDLSPYTDWLDVPVENGNATFVCQNNLPDQEPYKECGRECTFPVSALTDAENSLPDEIRPTGQKFIANHPFATKLGFGCGFVVTAIATGAIASLFGNLSFLWIVFAVLLFVPIRVIFTHIAASVLPGKKLPIWLYSCPKCMKTSIITWIGGMGVCAAFLKNNDPEDEGDDAGMNKGGN